MGLLDAPALTPKAAASAYAPFPARNVSGRARPSSGQSNGTDLTQTSRLRYVIRGSVGEVRLVFANFYLPTGGTEPANPYSVNVKASVEDPSVSTGSPTGAITIPVFFNGKRVGVLEPGGILISDPVYVNVADGQPLWVRSSPTVATGEKWVNTAPSVGAADVKFDGSGGSEGLIVGSDYVDSGTISISNSNAFGPNMIIGAATGRKPSCVVLGDSIAAATGLISQGVTMYPARAAIRAGFPVLNLAEGGEKALTVIQQAFYWKRMRLASMHTDALVNYGTNDIYGTGPRTLAQLKADSLSLWTLLKRLGLRSHAFTLLPRPGSSTDGYITVASQTITDSGKEAIRTAFNDWLRDTSASGARAQSNGALVNVFDAASIIEVNSSGVPTVNGGYIKAAGAAVLSGTATGVTSSVITDTGASRTVNADQTLTLAITGGTTGANQAQEILSNTATAWTLLGTLSPTPTGTVTYKIGPSYIYDGIHPTELASTYIGDNLDLSVITA